MTPLPPTMQAMVLMRHDGRNSCAGAITGPMVALDLRKPYLRDLAFTGSTVVAQQVFRTLISHINAERLVPMLAATYPLAELRRAQQAFIDKCHTGNIVVLP